MPDFHQRIHEQQHPTRPQTRGFFRSRKVWWLVVLLGMIVVGFGIGVTAKAILSVNSTNADTGEKVVFFDQLKRLVLSSDKQLNGEAEDRVNILLVGIGGAGHQGAYLADTIILTSIKPSTKEVAMLSIPRDLLVDIPGYEYRKINNALAFGQSDDYPGGGETLLSRVVSEVTGQQIHYFARIDFEGFKKVIDDLGGIWIDVDRAFVDYEYPDNNFGYQTLRFESGLQKMDGDRALKYVRSRHGTNGEGSDFARSKRQQKVIAAVKAQGLSFETLITPKRIIDALEDLGQHNRTNLQIWEILRLAQLAGDLGEESIMTKVLDNSADNLLISSTTPDGAYVLIPKAGLGVYTEIHALAADIFSDSQIAQEAPRIEIQNGSTIAGLAANAAEDLEQSPVTIVGVSNAEVRTYQTTMIYDLTGGTKPASRGRLERYFGTRATTTLPEFLSSTTSPVDYDSIQSPANTISESPKKASVDFLVIVGSDQASRLTSTGQ